MAVLSKEETRLNVTLLPATGRLLWFRLGITGLAVLLAYVPILRELASEWIEFPNLSHGFAIPLIAGYLIWTRRGSLGRLMPAPSWSGLPILLSGLVLCATGVLGGEIFLARISLPITLFGAATFVAGKEIAKGLLPGIGYLTFMIPLPYVTLKALTEQSRMLDATVTAAILPWLGVPVLQTGFLLHLPNITLEVANGCSSIPATASLLALGAAYGFISDRSAMVRLVLILTAIPLGIASNIFRIILSAISVYLLGPMALNNIIHKSNGTTVFLMTLGALILIDSGLRRLSRWQ